MEEYVGMSFQFRNNGLEKELKANDIEIEDYDYGTIIGLGCEIGTDFESNYWNIKLNDGRVFYAISGYNLEIIEM